MMKRTDGLSRLLAELEAEKPDSIAVIQDDSRLVVAVQTDPVERHEFTGPEARLLLANADTVERLFDALDYPEECFVELHNLDIEDDLVMGALSSYASTVDNV